MDRCLIKELFPPLGVFPQTASPPSLSPDKRPYWLTDTSCQLSYLWHKHTHNIQVITFIKNKLLTIIIFVNCQICGQVGNFIVFFHENLERHLWLRITMRLAYGFE